VQTTENNINGIMTKCD